MTSIPPRQLAYLLDIFQSVQAIQSYVGQQTHEEFLKDAKTQDAVLRRFLVAGEAATRLTPETRAEFPGIPFPKIAGMRNRVVHDYGMSILRSSGKPHKLTSLCCSRSFSGFWPSAAKPDTTIKRADECQG